MSNNISKEEMMTMMNSFKESIIDALKPDIEKITNEILPKINQKININVERINTNEAEIVEIKEKLENNMNEVDELKENEKDITERMNKKDKDMEMMNLKINELENDKDNRHDDLKNSFEKRIKEMESRIEKIDNNVKDCEKEKSTSFANIVMRERENENVMKTAAEKLKELTEKVMNVDKIEESSLIDDARKKLGVYPLKEGHIAKHAAKEHNLTNVSNIELFNSHLYTKARIEAAQDFLELELKFERYEIEIKETKMSKDGYRHIMWLTMTEELVKKIYQRAANIKSPRIQLLTYFPHSLYKKKIALEKLLKVARSKNESLRTQIRLGKKDLELFTKYRYEPYWTKTPLEEYGKIEIEPEITFSPPRERDEHSCKRKDISPNGADGDPKRNRTNSEWFDDNMTEDTIESEKNGAAREDYKNTRK